MRLTRSVVMSSCSKLPMFESNFGGVRLPDETGWHRVLTYGSPTDHANSYEESHRLAFLIASLLNAAFPSGYSLEELRRLVSD